SQAADIPAQWAALSLDGRGGGCVDEDPCVTSRLNGLLRISSLGTPRQRVHIDKGRAGARFFYQITDEIHPAKFRIGDVKARRVTKEVEHQALFDNRFDRESNGLEKPVKLPAAAAEGADVADRAHWHFDQTPGVNKGLRLLLGLYDAVVDGGG